MLYIIYFILIICYNICVKNIRGNFSYKKIKRLLLGLSSLLLATTLVGCSDNTARTYKDGKEADVEKAAIKLVNTVKTGDHNLMSADELKKALEINENMILVDTMPADNFKKSHIKTAVNAVLPTKLDKVKPEEKEAFLKALGDDKDKKIVLYCGFVGCERSHVGALIAKETGFKNVYRFPGGIAAWLDAGNSVEK